jgi:hypothetical protein
MILTEHALSWADGFGSTPTLSDTIKSRVSSAVMGFIIDAAPAIAASHGKGVMDGIQSAAKKLVLQRSEELLKLYNSKQAFDLAWNAEKMKLYDRFVLMTSAAIHPLRKTTMAETEAWVRGLAAGSGYSLAAGVVGGATIMLVIGAMLYFVGWVISD